MSADKENKLPNTERKEYCASLACILIFVFRKCRICNLLFGILFICMGCAQLRPYVSSERGSMDIRIKTELWDGQAFKRYYITAAEEIVNLGDSKQRLTAILGHPDDLVLSLGGYEIWVYKGKRVKFYFDDDAIKMIRYIDDKGISQQ